MFEKFLEELGLSDKESKVYLALLEVDSYSVVDLSKKTGINRTTIYPILESLSKKGLISEVKVDKKVRFAAEPPERLETYVERRKLQLEEQEKRLKDVIPQLKSAQREEGEKPVIKYFEGKEGALSANEEYIKSAKNDSELMYMIYPRDLLEEIFTESDLEKHKKIRTGSKIQAKSVFTYTKGKYESDKNSDRVQIDSNKYPIKADISVFEDKIRISTLGKKISTLLIKNIDLATTLKTMIKYIHDKEKGS